MTKIFDKQINSQKTSISRHESHISYSYRCVRGWPTGMHRIPSVGDIHDSGMHWMSTPVFMNETTCHVIQQITGVTYSINT